MQIDQKKIELNGVTALGFVLKLYTGLAMLIGGMYVVGYAVLVGMTHGLL